MAEMQDFVNPGKEPFGSKESGEKEASLAQNLGRRWRGRVSQATLSHLLFLFLSLGLFLLLAAILVQVSRLRQQKDGSADQQWHRSLATMFQQIQSGLQQLVEMNASLVSHLQQQRYGIEDQQWNRSLATVSQQIHSDLGLFHQQLTQMNTYVAVSSQQVQKDLELFRLHLTQMNTSLVSHLHRQRDNPRDQQWNHSLASVSQQIQSGLEEIRQQLAQMNASLAGSCHPCPLNWELFQGSCYFFSGVQRNWKTSQSACQAQKAQLVIINSKEEENFLQSWGPRIKKSTWIGLSDQHSEGSWLWVDGSPLRLSFWRRGEPNNSGDEDCVELQDDGWNDGVCNLDHVWVCEKPETPCPGLRPTPSH